MTGTAARSSPQRWDFERLRRNRPDIGRLPALEGHLLGHTDLRERISHVLGVENDVSKSILVIAGQAGSGKSAVIEWARRLHPDDSVILQDVASTVGGLRSDGANVPAVVGSLTRARSRAPVLLFDDIDSILLPDAIGRLAREAVSSVEFRLFLVTTRTPLPATPLPIPVQSVSLEHRRATREEFDAYIDRAWSELGLQARVVSEDVADTLFRLEEETLDFRAVQYVIEMIAAQHQLTHVRVEAHDLYDLLTQDPHIQQFRSFPGLHVTDGRRLAFRRKDKTELLAEVIMRIYESPREVALVCEEQLPGFDSVAFLAEAEDSLRDALMALCLTRTPVDLVHALLGPRDLLREIEALELDQSKLFDVPEARARLLVRGLGFTLVEPPRGLQYHAQHVRLAREALERPDCSAEFVRGTGLTVVQHVESVLLDLLSFWGTYLYESINELVVAYGRDYPQRHVRAHRLTIGDVVALLRYLDDIGDDVQRNFALRLVGRVRPLSDDVLEAASAFVERRNSFIHMSGMGVATRTALLIEAVQDLLSGAEALLDGLYDGAYPTVIKLVEIVFDEYSRRVFRAVDETGNDIRFSLTEENDDQIVVSSHYFMLPVKRVCVNPVLVPTGGLGPRVLFERGEEYERASTTQHAQGAQLLSLVEVPERGMVLDVGSGNGVLSLELARQFPTCMVDGIDISQDMVGVAISHLDDDVRGRVRFEVADLLSYVPDRHYDVVFSNSTMHWVLPSDRAYRRLFEALRRGGRMAVHQGGHGTYRGLWQCAVEVIEAMDLSTYFANWAYPAYYPTSEELTSLLQETGFMDVDVESFESDGSELGTLYRDFASAGLLPFVARIPEIKREAFRSEFIHHAERTKPDRYTHRLFVKALRP